MIEWPSTREERTEKSPDKGGPGSGLPVRNIIVVVAVIAAGVLVMEYFSGSSTVPQSVAPQPQMQSGAAGADMSALPHIQELEAQVNADPNNLVLRRELGNHLMDNRFYDRAVGVYKAVLEREPTDANVRVDMGICYKELGDLQNAETEMLTALQHDPKHLHGHFNLGIVKLVQGDVKAASEWFRKTAELDPKSDLGQRARQLLEQHMSIEAQ